MSNVTVGSLGPLPWIDMVLLRLVLSYRLPLCPSPTSLGTRDQQPGIESHEVGWVLVTVYTGPFGSSSSKRCL
jgi:hypothetical protein